MTNLRRFLAAAVVLCLGYGVSTLPADAAEPAALRVEVFAPDGTIARTAITVDELPRATRAAPVEAEVVTIQRTGDSADRYDLVFVGDGYTAAEQDLFHEQAVARWQQLITHEPFESLRDSFNVWQVNAISNESGSDNDPTPGVQKDTVLNSGFHCGDLARLICVDTAVTSEYAALAPGADQTLVLVNSTTYGGSGGTVSVSSGGNPQSGEIALHELGHSMAGLADEYGGPGTHPGGEPAEPNVSLLDEAAMRARGAKWAAYLGRPTPDGGVIGAYEGGNYFDRGVYRPSEDSIMRTLGNEFNLIGIDRLTEAIIAHTR